MVVEGFDAADTGWAELARKEYMRTQFLPMATRNSRLTKSRLDLLVFGSPPPTLVRMVRSRNIFIFKHVYSCYRYYTIVRSPRGQVCQMASCSVAVTISLLWTISLAIMVPLFLYQDVDVVTVGGEWTPEVVIRTK